MVIAKRKISVKNSIWFHLSFKQFNLSDVFVHWYIAKNIQSKNNNFAQCYSSVCPYNKHASKPAHTIPCPHHSKPHNNIKKAKVKQNIKQQWSTSTQVCIQRRVVSMSEYVLCKTSLLVKLIKLYFSIYPVSCEGSDSQYEICIIILILYTAWLTLCKMIRHSPFSPPSLLLWTSTIRSAT